MTRDEFKNNFWDSKQSRWRVKQIINRYGISEESFEEIKNILWNDIRTMEKGLRSSDIDLLDSFQKRLRSVMNISLDPYYIGRAPVKWNQMNFFIEHMVEANQKYMNLSNPDLAKFLWTNYQLYITQPALLRKIQQILKDQKDKPKK